MQHFRRWTISARCHQSVSSGCEPLSCKQVFHCSSQIRTMVRAWPLIVFIRVTVMCVLRVLIANSKHCGKLRLAYYSSCKMFLWVPQSCLMCNHLECMWIVYRGMCICLYSTFPKLKKKLIKIISLYCTIKWNILYILCSTLLQEKATKILTVCFFWDALCRAMQIHCKQCNICRQLFPNWKKKLFGFGH